MAKQDKQKQKDGQGARQQSVASAPTHSDVTTTRTIADIEPSPTPKAVNVWTRTDGKRLVQVPKNIRRRQFMVGGFGLAASAAAMGGLFWYATRPPAPVSKSAATVDAVDANNGDQLVIRWNNMALDVLRDQKSPLPVAARALSIVNTSMYDAWAAYDDVALGTRMGANLRRPVEEQTLVNKSQAISYAAYHALLGLFPTEKQRFQRVMSDLQYDPSNHGTNTNSPIGIGNLAAQAVLTFRHTDGSNQLGNLRPGAYSDYTNYKPLNTSDTLISPNHWQPLGISDGRTALTEQHFVCAQWADVTPFALASALQFVPKPGPSLYPSNQYNDQAQQILRYSANLTDGQKVIAEYWTATTEVQILTRWFAFARYISARDNHTLDQNVKMFFGLANVALDTSIACWATKRAYSSAYPVTVIRYLFKDKPIKAWSGPGKGSSSGQLLGQYWLPYQPISAISPAYPEYCSEQSAFSAACAAMLRYFTGNDRLGATYTQHARSSSIEPGVPLKPVTLAWRTLTQASLQAGVAGLYSGTHFPKSNVDGRLVGNSVAEQVWYKAQGYIRGQTRL